MQPIKLFAAMAITLACLAQADVTGAGRSRCILLSGRRQPCAFGTAGGRFSRKCSRICSNEYEICRGVSGSQIAGEI